MIIGGFQPFSCVDYPGKTCAIIFTRGCNFRCPYCHNPELVLPNGYAKPIDMEETFRFLETRKGLIDGVCVTGGEPTLHPDLPEVLRRIRSMGFLIKLDTNGSKPETLRNMFNARLVDYVAMDIKAPPESYRRITGFDISAETIRRSIRMIIDSGIDHEFRTTIVRELTTFDDLRAIVEDIRGAKRYYLQRFVQTKMNDPSLASVTSYSEGELRAIMEEIKHRVEICAIR